MSPTTHGTQGRVLVHPHLNNYDQHKYVEMMEQAGRKKELNKTDYPHFYFPHMDVNSLGETRTKQLIVNMPPTLAQATDAQAQVTTQALSITAEVGITNSGGFC